MTCLSVSGNRATIAFAVESGFSTLSDHNGHLIFVEDNGSPGDGRDIAKQQCKNGGWRQFGFANQGRCVAFVERGERPSPLP